MNNKLIEKLLEKLIDSDNVQHIESENSGHVHPWKVGDNYFIRTVTMNIVGKLLSVTDKELLLENASWIADTGRFHDALKTGVFDEIEPFVDLVIVNRNSIIDATFFRHELPLEQK